METLPMPLAGFADGLDDFRLDNPRAVTAMLRQLCEGDVPLQLHAMAGGESIAATLWTADAQRATLGFAIDVDDAALPHLLESRTVAVVGYFDSVKIQFDVHDLVLVRGERTSILNASFPHELFRFQRRNAYRVRPPLRSTPIARVRHTDIADMQLALRIVDISSGGCALFLPDDVPAMQIGGVMNQVRMEIDDETQFSVDLRLQHATSLNAESGGVRLGCEFVRADAMALRALQRFIDQAQQRSRLLALDD